MNHIDQEAELYALGMLDDAERARVDEHVATCDACAVLVGQAEAAMAALIDASQARRPRAPTAWWPVAVAAAFALTSAALFGDDLALRGAVKADGGIFATLVNNHFDHTQFQTPGGKEIAAKAIYERHGKWFEILADGAPAWHVVLIESDGIRRPVTTPFDRRGAASTVYVEPGTAVNRIDLEDEAGKLVGSARPALLKDTAYERSR